VPIFDFRINSLSIKPFYFTYQKADTINYQPEELKNRNKNLSDSSKTNKRIIMIIVTRFANLKVRKNVRREKQSFFTNSNTDFFNLAEINKPWFQVSIATVVKFITVTERR